MTSQAVFAPAHEDDVRVAALIRDAETAWNAGDASAYVRPFDAGVDFVNVYGQCWRGRDELLQAHQQLFAGPFAGSTNRYDILDIKKLTPDVALVHVEALMTVPAGPLAGQRHAFMTIVAQRRTGDWSIAALHNTMISPLPTLR
jgi:uncharacterized protein (TIGR02246 family)